MDDWQLTIYEENFIESFTEPMSNGSLLGFEEILRRREENDKKAEEQWSKEFYGTKERLVNNDEY